MGKEIDIHLFLPVSLDVQQLSYAVTSIADKAHKAADKAASHVELSGRFGTENVSPQLNRVRQYARLAVDMEYLRDTRLPLLPASATLEMSVDEVGLNSFQKLLKGEHYSLYNLACSQRWFEAVSRATDVHIPRAKIDKAARKYSAERNIPAILKSQIHDDFKKKVAIEIVGRSKSGKHLLQQVAGYGYEYHFVDLRLYNLIAHDKLSVTSAGICYSDGAIFVDTAGSRNDISRALTLSHEAAHALQFSHHCGREKYKTEGVA